MKEDKKNKQLEEKKDNIKRKYLEESEQVLEKYFPKGNKRRGEALAILSVSFVNGVLAGKEISELNTKFKHKE